MKNICRNLLVATALSFIMLAPAAVRADNNTTVTQTCYDNAYGERTCVENKETKTETTEKVVVVEKPQERVVVTEHQVMDTALSRGQIIALMAMMMIGLAGIVYKVRQA